MLTIRLQRTGKRNQASFRIVLAEKAAPVKKKHLEILGAYNPRKKNFQVNEERVKYWVSQRVELSPTVHNLFVTKGLVQAPKVQAFSVKKKPAEAKAAEAPSEGKKLESPVAESVESVQKLAESSVESKAEPLEASSASEGPAA